MDGSVIAVAVIAVAALIVISAGLKIVPQAQAAIIERLGRYKRTLDPGLHLLIPFADRVRANVDLREQVQSFPPQPVITEDNLVVNIDSVVYFQVTEARAAVYEIEDFIQGIEQITVTTLRNVIGGMSLERTLTSRDDINQQLRGVLDEATGRWGIRVNRVELKSIDPPTTIQQAMETQMRADRDKRAAILKAEGEKQSQILTAEGEQQSQVLRATGERDAEILRAEGQARAIEAVFKAIHEGRPDNELLAYQYLQALPKIAQGSSNKMWIVPSDFAQTLGTMGPMLGAITQAAQEGGPGSPAQRSDDDGDDDGAPALPSGRPY